MNRLNGKEEREYGCDNVIHGLAHTFEQLMDSNISLKKAEKRARVAYAHAKQLETKHEYGVK